MNSKILVPFLALMMACGGKGDDAAAGGKKTDAAKPMALDAYVAALTPAACATVTSCKQQEYAAGVQMMMMMMAGFGNMGDKEAQAQLEAVGKGMEAEKRFLLKADECAIVMGLALKGLSFNAPTLQASIDAGKAEFDGVQGAKCVAQLKSEPAFCKEEKKLEAELQMAAAEPIMKALDPMMDEYMKPCEGVINGKVVAGEACAQDFECAGKDAKCRDKKCVAPPSAPAAAE